MSESEISQDITNRLFIYGEQLAGKLSELGQEYGSDVLELTLNVYRIQAAQGLVAGFACLLAVILLVFAWRHFSKRIKYESDYMPLGVLVSIPICGFSIAAFVYLSDVWNWIGLWHPEVLMAKQILEAL